MRLRVHILILKSFSLCKKTLDKRKRKCYNYDVMLKEREDPNDSCSALEKAKEKYVNSEKGKASYRRYALSEKGKLSKKKYFESEIGKAALFRYYVSEKAETARQQRQALIKLFRKLDKYLRNNPDKTTEDYFNSIN